jgi:hypothetical protein
MKIVVLNFDKGETHIYNVSEDFKDNFEKCLDFISNQGYNEDYINWICIEDLKLFIH